VTDEMKRCPSHVWRRLPVWQIGSS